MLLYDLSTNIPLSKFGIDIPTNPDKITKILEYLKSNKKLSYILEKNILSTIDCEFSKEDLERVHSKDYVARLFSTHVEEEVIRAFELQNTDGTFNRFNPNKAVLPLSKLFEIELKNGAGVFQCLSTAINDGFCYYFGGGRHHGKFDYGDGFCIINDIVVAIRKLQSNNLADTVWVIDVDAHKGDGTAILTQNDPSIITLSIHMANGWPLDRPEYENGIRNHSHISSDIDIKIASGEEDIYNARLKEGLSKLSKYKKPQIALVLSGVDTYEFDELPSTYEIKMTIDQIFERDMMVYNFLKENGIPMAYLMAGGYGKMSWRPYSKFLEEIMLQKIKK